MIRPRSLVSYPSPKGGGWSAKSAFTRVFDALWPTGRGMSHRFDPTRPLAMLAATLPLQGRDGENR